MESVYFHFLEKQGHLTDLMSQYKPSLLLGQGSQGKVYLATHVVSKKEYAVKMISKAANNKFHARSEREFQEIEVM